LLIIVLGIQRSRDHLARLTLIIPGLIRVPGLAEEKAAEVAECVADQPGDLHPGDAVLAVAMA
jgi:hypothetical protein